MACPPHPRLPGRDTPPAGLAATDRGSARDVSPRRTGRRRPGWRWLLAIAAGALLIRLLGIDYGLPFKLVDDEWIEVRRALLLGTGVEQTEPFRLFKALLYLVLFVEYGIFYVVGRLTGLFLSPDDLGVLYLAAPGPLYLIGRATSALFGAMTVWLTGRLGGRLFGPRVGLFAAAALALAPLHAEFSHYIRVDVLLTLLTTAGLLATLSLREDPRLRRAVVCALLLALATLAKLSGALLVMPMILALLIAPGSLRLKIRRGAILALVALGVYVALNRHIVTEIARTFSLLDDVVGSSSHAQTRFLPQTPDRPASNLAYYAQALWPSYGPLPILAGLAGILIAVGTWYRGRPRRGETGGSGATRAGPIGEGSNGRGAILRHSTPLLFAAGFTAVFLGPGNMVNKTYLLPVEPVLWIYAAAAVVWLARWRPRGAVCLGAALLTWPAAATVLVEVRLLSTDTRIEAREWIEARWPAGTPVFIDSLIDGPALDDQPANRIARFHEPRSDGLQSQSELHDRLSGRIHPEKPYRFIYDPVFLRSAPTLDETLTRGARLITCNSRYRDAVLSPRGRERFPEAAAFYESLDQDRRIRLLKTLRPRRILLAGLEMAVQAGPEIRIYQVCPPQPDKRDGQ